MSTSWGTEGSCCAMVLVRNRQCFVAHCGDCMVTLARMVAGKPTAIALTDAHDPGKPAEKRRITGTGARVMATRADPDTLRVWPGGAVVVSSGLAVSRSIGNYNLREWGVIPDPATYEFDLASNDLFIALTSDGIGDIIAPQVMVDRLHEAMAGGETLAAAVDAVVASSADIWQKTPGFEGTYVDDATLVACCLQGAYEKK